MHRHVRLPQRRRLRRRRLWRVVLHLLAGHRLQRLRPPHAGVAPAAVAGGYRPGQLRRHAVGVRAVHPVGLLRDRPHPQLRRRAVLLRGHMCGVRQLRDLPPVADAVADAVADDWYWPVHEHVLVAERRRLRRRWLWRVVQPLLPWHRLRRLRPPWFEPLATSPALPFAVAFPDAATFPHTAASAIAPIAATCVRHHA